MSNPADGQDAVVSDILDVLNTDEGANDATNEQPEDLSNEASVIQAVEKVVNQPDQQAEPTPEDKAAKEPPIDPPTSWDADAKERFKALPPELKKVISERDREREAHFSKTQRETADERKALQADRDAAKQVRETYTQRLTHYINEAETLDPVIAEGRKTDWETYLAQDPVNAPAKHLAYVLKEQRLGQLIKERDGQAAVSAQEEQAAIQEQTQKAGEKLAEVLKDEWVDPDKRKAFQAQIKDYLLKNEYSAEELKGIRDPRAILITRKAALYDQLMEQQAQIASKKVPPAPLKIQKTKAADDVSSSSAHAERLWKRAAKSGRTDDSVDAIVAALNS